MNICYQLATALQSLFWVLKDIPLRAALHFAGGGVEAKGANEHIRPLQFRS